MLKSSIAAPQALQRGARYLAMVLWMCALLIGQRAVAGPVLHSGVSTAPTTAPNASAPQERPLVQLGPGDLVTLSVFGRPEMDGNMYVADDGTLRVPLAGPVQVAGMSPVEAAQAVEKALVKGQFLVDPQVTITVSQSRSQRVSVLGEVRAPGRYTIDSNSTIFDLLAQAGGTTDNSADNIYVMRPDKDGHITRYTINLRGFADAHDALPTQMLQGGDSVYVPKADQYFISGEVQAPNSYRLEPGMTVTQAIARAGGITARGSERRVEIKRRDKNGNYVILHPKPSEQVEPDDVIRVKESIF